MLRIQRMFPNLSSVAVMGLVIWAMGVGTAGAALQTITNSPYFDITYDTAQVGLFGAPSVSGTTIFFTPNSFSAESVDGQGTVATTSMINLILTAKNGFDFGALALTEIGDYRLDGSGSSVTVGGQLIAFDEAAPIDTYSYSFITAAPGLPLNVNDDTLHPWRASAHLNVAENPFFGPAVLRVGIQNQLVATTTAAGGMGSHAFIQKKFEGTQVIALEVVALPAPDSSVLLSIGLIPLVWLVRAGRVSRSRRD